jgi:hypothetical protein
MTMVIDTSVTITRREYANLLSAKNKLLALQAAGVDNWDGYDYAMEILNGDDDDSLE